MAHITSFDQAILEIDQEIEIAADPVAVFEGMIQQLTIEHKGGPDAPALPLQMERWPGGRWYRDLGDNHGHLWGFVQSYRPPTLLELRGPLFMSYPVVGHMIIRFEDMEGSTRLSFRYSAFGMIDEEHREGIQAGFGSMLTEVKERIEGAR